MPSPSSSPTSTDAASTLELSRSTLDFLDLFFNPVFTAIPETPQAKEANNPVYQFKSLSPEFLSLNAPKQGYGLFVSVNSFIGPEANIERPKRDQAHLSHLSFLYCDIDAPKDKTNTTTEVQTFKTSIIQLLQKIDPVFPLTALVETKNGFHCYWRLIPPVPVNARVINDKELAPGDISKRIEDYLQCLSNLRGLLQGDDQAKDLTRVLRIPNTLHQKDPNDPHVTLLRSLRKDKAYDLTTALRLTTQLLTAQDAKLHSFLSDEISKYASPKQGAWPIAPNETPLVLQRANALDVPTHVKDDAFKAAKDYLDRVYPKKDRPSIQTLVSRVAPNGSRNITLLILASAYRESGVSEAEVKSLFSEFSGLSKRECMSTIESAYREARPYDFAWNHPVLAGVVTKEERSHVMDTVSSFMTEYFNTWRRGERKRNRQNKSNDEATDGDASKDADDTVSVATAPRTTPEVERLIESPTPIKVDEEKLDAKEARKLFTHFADRFFDKHPYFYSLNGKAGLNFVDGSHKIIHMDDLEMMIRKHMDELGLHTFMTRGKIGDVIENVLKDYRRFLKEDEEFQKTHAFLIPARNGLVDISTPVPTITPYQPDHYISPCFSVSFDQTKFMDAKQGAHNRFRKFLLELASGDAEVAAFLEEMLGYCLTTSVEAEKAFILYGDGANGKSTLVDVLQTILGSQFATSLTLGDLKNSFMVMRLYMKRLNVVDEVSSSYFESDMFKRIVTGNRIVADRKFLDAVEFRPHAKIIFAVNQLPRVNDQSNGFFRRVITVPFQNTFEPNPEFTRFILSQEMLEEALATAVVGLQRWLERGKKFSLPLALTARLEEYRESNSPLIAFLNYTFNAAQSVEEALTHRMSALDLYRQYKSFCIDYGCIPKALMTFRTELQALRLPTFPLLRVDHLTVSGLIPKTGTLLTQTSRF